MRRILICLFLFLSTCVYPIGFEKVISLGPSITEELYLLGAGDNIVGVTTYCIRPKEAQLKEKVGTVMEIDIEKIISLRPDLVIATPLTDRKGLEKLKDMGINIINIPLAKNFSELCNQFLGLGRIVGKEEKAKKILQKAQGKVSKVKNFVKDIPKLNVFVQVGARPLFTMTKDSFINDYIELAGGINIAKEDRSGLYSRERVLEQDPDIILIVTMGITGEREKKIWGSFKNLKAVRNKRIYILNSYKMCSPTPVSFAQMLEELAGILHAI